MIYDMSEEGNPQLNELIKITPEEQQREDEVTRKGHIPERWYQIKNIESTRIREGLEAALEERKKAWTEQDFGERKQTAQRYIEEQLLPSTWHQESHEAPHSNYAAAHWRNFFEVSDRVVDRKQDEELISGVDPRVPFYSRCLEKQEVINELLADKIQATLGGQALTEDQLFDCFTNISPEQLDVISDQIARSGLTLRPESPKEHWERIARESRSRKDAQ